jgi:hypothetical protein
MNVISSKAFFFYLIKNIEYKYPHSEKIWGKTFVTVVFEINVYGIQNYFLGKNTIFFDRL